VTDLTLLTKRLPSKIYSKLFTTVDHNQCLSVCLQQRGITIEHYNILVGLFDIPTVTTMNLPVIEDIALLLEVLFQTKQYQMRVNITQTDFDLTAYVMSVSKNFFQIYDIEMFDALNVLNYNIGLGLESDPELIIELC
jgi:hypothetical protein